MTEEEFKKKLAKILQDSGISDKDKLANLPGPIFELTQEYSWWNF